MIHLSQAIDDALNAMGVQGDIDLQGIDLYERHTVHRDAVVLRRNGHSMSLHFCGPQRIVAFDDEKAVHLELIKP